MDFFFWTLENYCGLLSLYIKERMWTYSPEIWRTSTDFLSSTLENDCKLFLMSAEEQLLTSSLEHWRTSVNLLSSTLEIDCWLFLQNTGKRLSLSPVNASHRASFFSWYLILPSSRVSQVKFASQIYADLCHSISWEGFIDESEWFTTYHCILCENDALRFPDTY